MPRFRIVYSETARSDLIEIGNYIEREAGDAIASRFVGRMIASVNGLRSNPSCHRVRQELGADIRARGFRKYLIFYRIETDTVVIVRILHSSRRITAQLFGE